MFMLQFADDSATQAFARIRMQIDDASHQLTEPYNKTLNQHRKRFVEKSKRLSDKFKPIVEDAGKLLNDVHQQLLKYQQQLTVIEQHENIIKHQFSADLITCSSAIREHLLKPLTTTKVEVQGKINHLKQFAAKFEYIARLENAAEMGKDFDHIIDLNGMDFLLHLAKKDATELTKINLELNKTGLKTFPKSELSFWEKLVSIFDFSQTYYQRKNIVTDLKNALDKNEKLLKDVDGLVTLKMEYHEYAAKLAKNGVDTGLSFAQTSLLLEQLTQIFKEPPQAFDLIEKQNGLNSLIESLEQLTKMSEFMGKNKQDSQYKAVQEQINGLKSELHNLTNSITRHRVEVASAQAAYYQLQNGDLTILNDTTLANFLSLQTASMSQIKVNYNKINAAYLQCAEGIKALQNSMQANLKATISNIVNNSKVCFTELAQYLPVTKQKDVASYPATLSSQSANLTKLCEELALLQADYAENLALQLTNTQGVDNFRKAIANLWLLRQVQSQQILKGELIDELRIESKDPELVEVMAESVRKFNSLLIDNKNFLDNSKTIEKLLEQMQDSFLGYDKLPLNDLYQLDNEIISDYERQQIKLILEYQNNMSLIKANLTAIVNTQQELQSIHQKVIDVNYQEKEQTVVAIIQEKCKLRVASALTDERAQSLALLASSKQLLANFKTYALSTVNTAIPIKAKEAKLFDDDAEYDANGYGMGDVDILWAQAPAFSLSNKYSVVARNNNWYFAEPEVGTEEWDDVDNLVAHYLESKALSEEEQTTDSSSLFSFNDSVVNTQARISEYTDSNFTTKHQKNDFHVTIEKAVKLKTSKTDGSEISVKSKDQAKKFMGSLTVRIADIRSRLHAKVVPNNFWDKSGYIFTKKGGAMYEAISTWRHALLLGANPGQRKVLNNLKAGTVSNSQQWYTTIQEYASIATQIKAGIARNKGDLGVFTQFCKTYELPYESYVHFLDEFIKFAEEIEPNIITQDKFEEKIKWVAKDYHKHSANLPKLQAEIGSLFNGPDENNGLRGFVLTTHNCLLNLISALGMSVQTNGKASYLLQQSSELKMFNSVLKRLLEVVTKDAELKGKGFKKGLGDIDSSKPEHIFTNLSKAINVLELVLAQDNQVSLLQHIQAIDPKATLEYIYDLSAILDSLKLYRGLIYKETPIKDKEKITINFADFCLGSIVPGNISVQDKLSKLGAVVDPQKLLNLFQLVSTQMDDPQKVKDKIASITGKPFDFNFKAPNDENILRYNVLRYTLNQMFEGIVHEREIAAFFPKPYTEFSSAIEVISNVLVWAHLKAGNSQAQIDKSILALKSMVDNSLEQWNKAMSSHPGQAEKSNKQFNIQRLYTFWGQAHAKLYLLKDSDIVKTISTRLETDNSLKIIKNFNDLLQEGILAAKIGEVYGFDQDIDLLASITGDQILQFTGLMEEMINIRNAEISKKLKPGTSLLTNALRAQDVDVRKMFAAKKFTDSLEEPKWAAESSKVGRRTAI